MTTITQIPAEITSEREDQLIKASDNRRAVLETIGVQMGFYDVLEPSPVTLRELAASTGASPSCARVWLEKLYTGGCLDFDPVTDRYSIWCLWPEGH